MNIVESLHNAPSKSSANTDPLRDPKTGLTAFPSSWFPLAFSDELKPGTLLRRDLCDEPLVVFKTESGQVSALHAYCPHQGADFSVGGAVVGESIQCPYHGFRFSTAGDCVAAYTDDHLCKGRISGPTLLERNGIIFAWHDPYGREPTWEIPELDLDGWSLQQWYRWSSVTTHVQEVHENGADLGHLKQIHRFQINNPYSELAEHSYRFGYDVERQGGVYDLRDTQLNLRLDTETSGLGYACATLQLQDLGVQIRIFILATPTTLGKVDACQALSLKILPHSRLFGWINKLPKTLRDHLTKWLAKALFVASKREFSKDLVIAEHKRYYSKPAMAVGDGPVSQYRRWANRFY